ncbi:MAG: mevalonate kinase, partial [Saprospiraceae bacterium]
HNSRAIQAILESDPHLFIDAWKNISINSLNYFDAMIPANIKQKWQEGIDTGKTYYKLCGAGGGGFFLKMEIN